MLKALFGANEGVNRGGVRSIRYSSGWTLLLRHLHDNEGLRVLDIGSTSPGNINFITGMGHGVYMADLVEEASKPEWILPAEGDEPMRFDVERFIAENFEFSGRMFDVVLLWDAGDYIPEPLFAAVVKRIQDVTHKGGMVLAFFHTKKDENDGFYRYHLTDSQELGMHKMSDLPLRHVLSNRQIEKLFGNFSAYKFLLAKDSLREVVITR